MKNEEKITKGKDVQKKVHSPSARAQRKEDGKRTVTNIYDGIESRLYWKFAAAARLILLFFPWREARQAGFFFVPGCVLNDRRDPNDQHFFSGSGLRNDNF
jgi:hypothetical protein